MEDRGLHEEFCPDERRFPATESAAAEMRFSDVCDKIVLTLFPDARMKVLPPATALCCGSALSWCTGRLCTMHAASNFFLGRNIPEINHSQQNTNFTRIISLAQFFFRASILPVTKKLTARNADEKLRITAKVGFAN